MRNRKCVGYKEVRKAHPNFCVVFCVVFVQNKYFVYNYFLCYFCYLSLRDHFSFVFLNGRIDGYRHGFGTRDKAANRKWTG